MLSPTSYLQHSSGTVPNAYCDPFSLTISFYSHYFTVPNEVFFVFLEFLSGHFAILIGQDMWRFIQEIGGESKEPWVGIEPTATKRGHDKTTTAFHNSLKLWCLTGDIYHNHKPVWWRYDFHYTLTHSDVNCKESASLRSCSELK